MDTIKRIWLAVMLACMVYAASAQSKQDSICMARGHAMGGAISMTAMYCPPRLIENDTISYWLHPACNIIYFTCQRCGKECQEREKEWREVIWRKPKDE